MSGQASSSGTKSAAQKFSDELKKAERMKKLKELHMKRVCLFCVFLDLNSFVFQNEASRLNHQEVVEEHKKQQLPLNWEKKKEWADYKLNEIDMKEKAKEEGIDYDRVKLLDVQADEAERWERKKMAKKNPDQGFSDYEAATAR